MRNCHKININDTSIDNESDQPPSIEDVLIKANGRSNYSGTTIEVQEAKSGSNGRHHRREMSIDTLNITPNSLSKNNSPTNGSNHLRVKSPGRGNNFGTFKQQPDLDSVLK